MAPPPPPRGRHLTARDALIVVGIVVFILVIAAGRSVRHAGKEMSAGWERSMVLAIGEPAGWLADKLPFQELVADATKPLKSGDDLASGPGGFDETGAAAAQTGVPPVTPDAFDPVTIGAKPVAPRPLKTLLVTGDSMSLILDAELARRLTDEGIKVVRDPHVGTGLSSTGVVDWGKLSSSQIKKDHPDAIVVFIGANEGFPLKYAGKNHDCCDAAWAAAYGNRARQLMNNYRQEGTARVYWLLQPAPRDPDRQDIAKVVRAADAVAANPYAAQVRLLDMSPIFTPDVNYRDAMDVGGEDKLVRQSDGIHLNQTGNEIVADKVLEAMHADYGDTVPAP